MKTFTLTCVLTHNDLLHPFTCCTHDRYDLHMEVVNTLIVLLSTQLFHPREEDEEDVEDGGEGGAEGAGSEQQMPQDGGSGSGGGGGDEDGADGADGADSGDGCDWGDLFLECMMVIARERVVVAARDGSNSTLGTVLVYGVGVVCGVCVVVHTVYRLRGGLPFVGLRGEKRDERDERTVYLSCLAMCHVLLMLR